MKIAILGAGAYGLALSCMFYRNKNEIHVWSKFQEEIDELKNNASYITKSCDEDGIEKFLREFFYEND